MENGRGDRIDVNKSAMYGLYFCWNHGHIKKIWEKVVWINIRALNFSTAATVLHVFASFCLISKTIPYFQNSMPTGFTLPLKLCHKSSNQYSRVWNYIHYNYYFANFYLAYALCNIGHLSKPSKRLIAYHYDGSILHVRYLNPVDYPVKYVTTALSY